MTLDIHERQGMCPCQRDHLNATRLGTQEEQTGAHEGQGTASSGELKSMEAALNLPDKRRGTMSLKSNGDRSEAERAEGEKRKQGQEVTWIQAKESLSFGLVTSKQWSLCVCVGRVSLTTSASFLPSFSQWLFSSGELLLFPSGDIPPTQKGEGMKSLRYCYKYSHHALQCLTQHWN